MKKKINKKIKMKKNKMTVMKKNLKRSQNFRFIKILASDLSLSGGITQETPTITGHLITFTMEKLLHSA